VSVLVDGYARRALIEVLLVGGLCGVVGVHVVLRRLSFFTMSMTHATFPGIVLAALLGLNLYLGAGLFGVLLVLAVAWLWSRPGANESSVVGVVLSAGFALGVLLVSAQPGFTKDLSAYLVGSVLTVQPADLVVTAGVGAAVLALLVSLRKELMLGAFDRGGLRALGYPAALLDIVLLLAIEATVVSAVPAVGVILSVALIVAPAATARLWTDRLATMTVVAVGVGAVSGAAGLVISQQARVSAGAAIVLVACGCFALSWLGAPRYGLVRRLLLRRRTVFA
jgi:ABC-type Mn2+/Zn2+ transport system permease subunit